MLKYRILFWQKIFRILFQFIYTSATGLTYFVYTSLKMFLVNVNKDEKNAGHYDYDFDQYKSYYYNED